MSIQSEVMSRAAELRSEGLNPSEALSEAWSELGANPDLECNLGEELIEVNPEYNPAPRRRRSANPTKGETISWVTVALLALAAFTFWYKSSKGVWWWSNLGGVRALRPMPARPMVTGNPQRLEPVHPKMTGLLPVYTAKNGTEEDIVLIDV